MRGGGGLEERGKARPNQELMTSTKRRATGRGEEMKGEEEARGDEDRRRGTMRGEEIREEPIRREERT